MTEGLFSEEEARHPMWTPPPITHAMPGHTRVLRKEIARQLTRFDGRTDMIVVITFCQTIYDSTFQGHSMNSPSWMIGDLTIRTAQTVAMLERSKKEASKRERSSDARDAAIIQGLRDKFVEAIIKEVTT